MNQEEVVAALLRKLGKPSSIFKNTTASSLTFVPPILFQEGFALVNGEDLCACETNGFEEACDNKDHMVKYLTKNEVQCLKKNDFGMHQGSLVCFNSLPVFMNFAAAFKNLLIPLALLGNVSAASSLEGRGSTSAALSGGLAPNFPARALNSTSSESADSNKGWGEGVEKFRKKVKELPAAVKNVAIFPEWALSSEFQMDAFNRGRFLNPDATNEDYNKIAKLIVNLQAEAKDVKSLRSTTESTLQSKKGSFIETAQELGRVEGIISTTLKKLEESRKEIEDIATDQNISKTAEKYGNLLTAILEVTEELLNLENYIKQKSMKFVEDLVKVVKDEAIMAKMNQEEKIEMQSKLESLDNQVRIAQKTMVSAKQNLGTVETTNEALKNQLQREVEKNNELSALMGQIEMQSKNRMLEENDRRSKILDLRTTVRKVGRQLLKERAKRVELETTMANAGLKNAESIETLQNNLEKCYSSLAALGSLLLGAGIVTSLVMSKAVRTHALAKKHLSQLVEAAKQMRDLEKDVTTTTSQLHEAQGERDSLIEKQLQNAEKDDIKTKIPGYLKNIYVASANTARARQEAKQRHDAIQTKGKGTGKGPPGPAPPRGNGKGAKLSAPEIPLPAGKDNRDVHGHSNQPVSEISLDPDTDVDFSPRSDSSSSVTSTSPGVTFTRAENLLQKLKQAIQTVARLQEKIKKGQGDHTTKSQIETLDAEIAKYKLLIPKIILNVNVPIWQLLYTRACKYPRDDLFNTMSTVLVKLCNGDLKELAGRYRANRTIFYKDLGIKFAPEDSTMEIATYPKLNEDVSSNLEKYLHHGLVQGITKIIETFASTSGYSARLVSDYAASVQSICTNTLLKLYALFDFSDRIAIVGALKLAFNQRFLWDDISQTFEENEKKDDEELGIKGEDELVCTRPVIDRMRNNRNSQVNQNTKDFIVTNGRPLMLINLAGAGPRGIDFWNRLIADTLERETVLSAPKKRDKIQKDNKQPSYCILFGKSPQCKDLPTEKEGVIPPYKTVTSQKTTPLMCMMGLLSYIRKCWSESSEDFKTNPSGISANWCTQSNDPRDKTCKNIAKIISQAVRNLAVGATSSLTEQQAKEGASYWNLLLTYIIKKYNAEPKIQDDFKIARALYRNDNMELVQTRIKQGFTAANDYNDVFEQIIHNTVGRHEEINPVTISESYSAIVDCLFLLQELVDFLQPQCGRTKNIKGKHVLRAPSHSPDVDKRSSALLAAKHETAIEEFKHKRDPTPKETKRLLNVDSSQKTQRARSADGIPRDSFHPADFRKDKKDRSIFVGARLQKRSGQPQITESERKRESESTFFRGPLKKVVHDEKSKQTDTTEVNSVLAAARSTLKSIK